ncbi:MAG TPA: metal-dependent hydrolase [Bryobacteraceae bacterium]|nr:metal-dependent hydrolase [Bryobacteraceae bacterium]
MDNITHSLTGLALSRAALDRFSPRAVWLLILSANAPDCDIVAASQGAFRYLEIHRGYTHSVIAAPALAALSVLVIALIFRERLPWVKAFALCLIGVASHLLLDWTNDYGVRLLLPFSSRWFHLDLNNLFDIWILLVLALAAIWPSLSKLVNREIGDRSSPAGRPIAIFALLFILFFDLGRMTMRNRVLAQLESRLYDGGPALQYAALPDAFDPTRWTGVIETNATYRIGTINSLGQWDPEQTAVFYKPPESANLLNARQEQPFRYFLYFARFPVWSIQGVNREHKTGTRLDLTDLRFGAPNQGSFHCIGYENQSNRLLSKRFTFGSGADLGWN